MKNIKKSKKSILLVQQEETNALRERIKLSDSKIVKSLVELDYLHEEKLLLNEFLGKQDKKLMKNIQNHLLLDQININIQQLNH